MNIGCAYDMSNSVHGNHSNIVGILSDGQAELSALAGADITGYLPPPLQLERAGLSSNP